MAESIASALPRRFATPHWRAVLGWRPLVTVEALVILASGYFALTANQPFWQAALAHAGDNRVSAVAVFVALIGLHGLLLGALVVNRWARPTLALLLVTTAFATYYMQAYGAYLDADMLRNVLHTDPAEARELLTPGLFPHVLLYAVLPGVVLYRVRVLRRRPLQAVLVRGAFLLGMWVLVMAAGAVSFKEVSSLLRNRHEVRYLITPANYLYGLGRLAFSQPPTSNRPLLPIAVDARATRPATAGKPRLLVLVVGETVRAQNWGLNGYRRQTTPRLAGLDIINFRDMQACGSSTEASLPCMFSPWGRAKYDEARIRSHQSLLHVLQRLGVEVLWRDNQSGCKGVCAGLAFESTAAAGDPVLCDRLRCLDEVLLKGLPPRAESRARDRVIVLHMLGNHGPSYFDRYPPEFETFVPTCRSAELGRCSRDQIVNAYDNAVLYTDHVLAGAIERLDAAEGYDSALIYLSDHGESLGEKGLYLHGMPYAIAPREQLRVPMLMWFKPRLAAAMDLDLPCLQRRAGMPVSHDNLFSTVLGLFDIRTAAITPGRDLLAACRGPGDGDGTPGVLAAP